MYIYNCSFSRYDWGLWMAEQKHVSLKCCSRVSFGVQKDLIAYYQICLVSGISVCHIRLERLCEHYVSDYGRYHPEAWYQNQRLTAWCIFYLLAGRKRSYS